MTLKLNNSFLRDYHLSISWHTDLIIPWDIFKAKNLRIQRWITKQSPIFFTMIPEYPRPWEYHKWEHRQEPLSYSNPDSHSRMSDTKLRKNTACCEGKSFHEKEEDLLYTHCVETTEKRGRLSGYIIFRYGLCFPAISEKYHCKIDSLCQNVTEEKSGQDNKSLRYIT